MSWRRVKRDAQLQNKTFVVHSVFQYTAATRVISHWWKARYG